MKNLRCLLWILIALVAMTQMLFVEPAYAQDADSAPDSSDIEVQAELTDEVDTISDDDLAELVETIESGDSTEPVDTGFAEGEGLKLNFRGVPLDTVLDYLSRAAGFIIIKTVDLTGTVDVWSYQPLTKDEAVDLLNTILFEQGYAAVRNGRILTIVTQDEAKKRNLPVRKGNDPKSIPMNDEMITQIIPVRHADALQLVANITPLLPSYATIAANESSNAIVLTDTQTNIHRIVQIIEALDTTISEVSTIKVYRLKHSDATETANVINQVFATDGSGGGGGNRNRMAEFFSRMRGGGGGGRGGGRGGRGGRGGGMGDPGF